MNEHDDIMQESAALAELMEARCYLYTLFHKVFGGQPTAEFLGEAARGACEGAWGAFAEEDETIGRLREHVCRLGGNLDKDAMRGIEAEYTRALIGPAALPAVPLATPWLTHEGASMSEVTLKVRAAYRERGLEPRALHHVPDDHVSLLCAYMARRGAEALELLRVGDIGALRGELESQCAFVRDYLASWLSAYASKVCTMKTALLYPQMAKGLAAFVERDLTLCASAMLWADEAGESFTADAALPAATDGDRGPGASALERLCALRPRGIEENELVQVETTRTAG